MRRLRRLHTPRGRNFSPRLLEAKGGCLSADGLATVLEFDRCKFYVRLRLAVCLIGGVDVRHWFCVSGYITSFIVDMLDWVVNNSRFWVEIIVQLMGRICDTMYCNRILKGF